MSLENDTARAVFAQMRRPLRYHQGDMWGPPQFTNWVDEEMSWKTTCYLGDWSFLPSVRSGSWAASFVT